MSEMEKENVMKCPSTPAAKARVSREKNILQDIKDGLTPLEISRKYNISTRTVHRIYKKHLLSDFILEVASDFYKHRKKVKPEVAYQTSAKILGDYFKEQTKQQTPAVTVNVNNTLPDMLRVQLDELIKIGEEVCINHPAHRQQNPTQCSDTPPPMDKKE